MLTERVDAAAATGEVPGGVLWVASDGAHTYHRAFGATRTDPRGSGAPVTVDTWFDVASLTKPVATTAVVMKLVDAGALSLADPVTRWVPELRDPRAAGVTLRELLCHASGLPAHLQLHERVRAGERMGAPSAREATLRMTAATPLVYEPRSRAIYSDLGYILLGFAAERAGGDRLDALAKRLVFAPLAMAASRFVDLAARWRPSPVAATERCAHRGLVQGEVHDPNTHAAGGILGQAGLFSTAADLGHFALAMMSGGGGFSPELVAPFLAPSGVPGSTWRHGWDTPVAEPGVSQAGDAWPRTGMGHLGFTGCSMWLDPARGRCAILLTNSIHPVVDASQKARIKRLRRDVMDAVIAETGG